MNRKHLLAIGIALAIVIVISMPYLQELSQKGMFITNLVPGVMESNGTEHSLYIKNATTGTYTYYVRCMDEGGNLSDEYIVNFNVNIPEDKGVQLTTQQSTGGGGGGGIAMQRYETIKAGTPKTFENLSSSISITKVSIVPSKNIYNAGIEIKRTTKPATTQEPSLFVYEYDEINYINMNESDITSSTIDFRISRAWIIKNAINPQKVYLHRYANIWNKLKTVIVKEDAEYYYFQANTPGFSLFAITGDVDAEILKQPEEKREETIATIQAQGTTQPTIEKPQPATNQLPFYLIIGIVGVVVGLIIFIVFVRTRKTTGKESASQSKEKQEPEKPRNACAICSQPITFKYQCSMCKRNMCINHVSLVGGRLVCHQCQK